MPFIIYRLLMNRQDHRFVQNCSQLEVRSHQSVGNSHSWEFRKKSLKQDLKGPIALSFLSIFLSFFFKFSITHNQTGRQLYNCCAVSAVFFYSCLSVKEISMSQKHRNPTHLQFKPPFWSGAAYQKKAGLKGGWPSRENS